MICASFSLFPLHLVWRFIVIHIWHGTATYTGECVRINNDVMSLSNPTRFPKICLSVNSRVLLLLAPLALCNFRIAFSNFLTSPIFGCTHPLNSLGSSILQMNRKHPRLTNDLNCFLFDLFTALEIGIEVAPLIPMFLVVLNNWTIFVVQEPTDFEKQYI
jgi:hypothetical protein